MADVPALPAGWGLALDRRARRPRWDVLVGGSPTRALRLTAGGARLLDRWAGGTAVTGTGGGARLARTLVDRGLAHPRPPATASVGLTVVIPVRNRDDGLDRTLAALGGDHPVVVVDDGSVDPAALRRRAGGATVMRRDAPGGPAAARNTGWPAVTTEAVALVDADVEISGADLAGLARHLADPAVGAVAPRIACGTGPATPPWLAAYEAVRSPLDLGDRPAPVRPGSVVPYVPTTVLVVRRSALAEVGGFDEDLRTGEDVDLVWRLVGAGWQVRYQPEVQALHPPRHHLRSWLRQRHGYGRSAAPLHRRHGSDVAPLVLSPWTALPVVAALAGLPAAAAGLSAAATAPLLARPHGVPRPALARLAALGQIHGFRATCEATRRTWWPLAFVAAVAARRVRPAVAAAFVMPPLVTWCSKRPRLDPVRFTALHVLDDVAYGSGVWWGVARTGELRTLLPVIRRRRRR